MSDISSGQPAPAGGHPAGWFADPYGRFQQRYWDGAAWTAHVSSGSQQQVDPMGTSTVVPFAIPTETTSAPPSAPPVQGIAGGSVLPPPPIEPPGAPTEGAGAGGSGGSNPVSSALDSMRPDSAERTRPSLTMALAGIAGVLIAIGVLILTGDDPSRGVIAAVGVAIIAAAVLVAMKLRQWRTAPATALGALIVGLVAFGVAATVGDGDAGFLTLLLIGGLHLVAWFVGPFKGKTLLLGLGLFVMIGSVATLIDGEGDSGAVARCEEFLDDGDFDSFDDNNCEEVLSDEEFGDEVSIFPTEIGDNVGTTGWVYLIGAGALLAATWWLDRRGYRGTGTGVAAAAIASALAGTAFAAVDLGGSGAWMLVTLVGVAVCVVGSHGSRRATTWWGSFLAAFGLLVFVALTLKPDGTLGSAAVAFVTGGLLLAAPALVRKLRVAQANDTPAT